MSEENVELVRRSNDALTAGGVEAMLLGETTGRIKGSGVPIREPLGTVYSEFRDGQIGETRNFLTWRQALEAAGLSE